MIFAILGASNAGKTTVLENLICLGLNVLINCTTRPMRKSEQNGKTYHFLEDEEYFEIERNGEIIAPFRVTCADGDVWYYGIRKKDIDLSKDCIIVIEPTGYFDLIRAFGKENVTGIYLKVDYNTRFYRGSLRGDDPKELQRRLLSDERDFKNLDEHVDFILEENSLAKVLDLVIRIIKLGKL